MVEGHPEFGRLHLWMPKFINTFSALELELMLKSSPMTWWAALFMAFVQAIFVGDPQGGPVYMHKSSFGAIGTQRDALLWSLFMPAAFADSTKYTIQQVTTCTWEEYQKKIWGAIPPTPLPWDYKEIDSAYRHLYNALMPDSVNVPIITCVGAMYKESVSLYLSAEGECV
jgi:hypothetical protein